MQRARFCCVWTIALRFERPMSPVALLWPIPSMQAFTYGASFEDQCALLLGGLLARCSGEMLADE